MQLKIRKFKLSEQFLESYKVREVPWGPVGYVTYKRTYARRLGEFEPGAVGTEEWWQTCRRVIEGMFNMQKQHVVSLGLEWNDAKAQRTAKDAYERLFTLKWTPPGRGLWMMGTTFVEERTAAGLFNCWKGDTKVLTRQGFKPIKDLVNTEQQIMVETGAWINAPIKSFGRQKLYKVNLKHQNGYEKTMYATGEHRWFARELYDSNIKEYYTKNLPENSYLQLVFGQGNKTTNPSPQGIQAGLVYGDGHLNLGRGRIVLCGDKNKDLVKYFPLNNQLEHDYITDEGSIIVDGLPAYYKDAPPLTEKRPYLYGWLMGYFAADGCVDKNGRCSISSTSKESLEVFKNVAAICGIGTLPIRAASRISNLTEEESIIYNMTIYREKLTSEFFLIEDHKDRFLKNKYSPKRSRTWKVISVEETDIEEEVYCATVEDYGHFVVEDHILSGNCAFRSTKDMQEKGGYIFRWMMDALMLGIGVGFDTLGAGTFKVQEPGTLSSAPKIPSDAVNAYLSNEEDGSSVCVVADSREGWVESIQVLLDAYIFGHGLPSFDYTEIREKGAPIRGFGGTSSGYEPLRDLHVSLTELYQNRVGEFIGSVDIVDTENLIGKCVVAGNVRRSAALALGQAEDHNYLTMKNDKEKLYSHRWGSNNSFHAKVGMDYTWHAEQSQKNGEPGYIWLDNARTYGRMKDPQRFDDTMVMGFNPCFSGDTLIAVADGRGAVPIEQLAKEGNDVPVYSMNPETGNVEIKQGRNPRITGLNKELLEITLDDDTTIRVTPNHKFYLRDGTVKEAHELNKNDSLPRLSKRLEKVSKKDQGKGYLRISTTTRSTKRTAIFEHRLISKYYNPSENWQSPDFRKKQEVAWTEERRKKASSVMSDIRNRLNLDYYKEQERLTDLDTIWVNQKLRAVKECEICSKKFDVSWSKRGQACCSIACSNEQEDAIRARRKGQEIAFANRQEEVLNKQITIYKDLECKHQRAPKKKEWENRCKEESVSFRIRSGKKKYNNPYILTSYKQLKNLADDFNHRVKSVKKVIEKATVYNISVDDYHTVGIVTKFNKETGECSGIYTAQCVEQQLEDGELCCVSADTRILTRTGNSKISDLVGKDVEVWNGVSWSKTTPFLAAKNKDLYRVYLSDGSYLDSTDDHKWSVRKPTSRTFRQLETKELLPGMRVESFEMSPIEAGEHNENAYRLGWFLGGGFIDRDKSMVLVQEKEYEILEELGGVVYKEQHPPEYKAPFRRVDISKHIDLEMAKHLRNSDLGLPDSIFEMDSNSISNFIGGWIDTDGSVRRNKNSEHYIICSTSHQKLLDAQILLRRIGVNHASVRLWSPKNSETNYGIRNKGLYCLLIPSYEAHLVNTKLSSKKISKFGSRYQKNNAHPDGKKIDMSRAQKILKVEKLDGKHSTYCFTEPERHMGVFGNVLTYQCLTETFPARHDSFEDYLKTLKISYMYAKTVTLSRTQWRETNAIMLKNRRIGLSMSGVVQAFNKIGRRELFNWCDNAYSYVQELDGVYSDWLCIPRSKRTTSIKPSGTVSLLNGSTPGIHFPEDEYYIRRIRFSEASELLPDIEAAGYPIEDDAYSPATKVVSFPVHEPFFVKGKREASMWEQLEIAAAMQYYWADNSVSVTVTFKPEEGDQLNDALQMYESKLKAVSFLKYEETGYVQAPYEPISKEEYEEMSSKITPIQRFSTLTQGGAGTKFCDGDSCDVDL